MRADVSSLRRHGNEQGCGRRERGEAPFAEIWLPLHVAASSAAPVSVDINTFTTLQSQLASQADSIYELQLHFGDASDFVQDGVVLEHHSESSA